jgi:hypothetical protein
VDRYHRRHAARLAVAEALNTYQVDMPEPPHVQLADKALGVILKELVDWFRQRQNREEAVRLVIDELDRNVGAMERVMWEVQPGSITTVEFERSRNLLLRLPLSARESLTEGYERLTPSIRAAVAQGYLFKGTLRILDQIHDLLVDATFQLEEWLRSEGLQPQRRVRERLDTYRPVGTLVRELTSVDQGAVYDVLVALRHGEPIPQLEHQRARGRRLVEIQYEADSSLRILFGVTDGGHLKPLAVVTLSDDRSDSPTPEGPLVLADRRFDDWLRRKRKGGAEGDL